MDNNKQVDSVNEFLRGSLREPDESINVLEETQRRLGALEVAKEDEVNHNSAVARALIKAIIDMKDLEKKLLSDVYDAQLKDSQQKLEDAKQREDRRASEKQEMINILKEVEAEKRCNEERQMEIEALIKKEFKSARATYQLYRNITGLDWNQDSGPEMCEGYVAREDDTKPFSLNKSELSPFFVANYLWGLMDDESKVEFL